MNRWIERALKGDRAVLARAISAVEDDSIDAAAVLTAVYPRVGGAVVVGFTGAPGAGKSTLVAAYVRELRKRNLGVGVVAVDPTSPFSGGSVLGDRIRMLGVASDSQVFVRSLAARGHLGGLSQATARVVDVLDAAGKDVVIIETVGVGQSETEVSSLAQVTCVVCAPGLGDDVQLLKAGVHETADILVLNKSDLPDAGRVMSQLRSAIEMNRKKNTVLLPTVAAIPSGIEELADTIADVHASRRQSLDAERLKRLSRTIEALVLEAAARKLRHLPETLLHDECLAVLEGRRALPDVVDGLLGRLS